MDTSFTSRELRRMDRKLAKREGRGSDAILTKTDNQYSQLVVLAHEARMGKFDRIPFAKAAEKLSAQKVFEASDYQAFTQRLIREYCYGKTFQESYHAFYNIAIILLAIQANVARTEIAQGRTTDDTTTLLLQAASQQFCFAAFPLYTDEEREWFLQAVSVLPDGFAKEMFADMDNYFMDFRCQRPFAKDIKRYMEEQLGLSGEEALLLRQDTNRLVGELKQLQRYPVQQSLYDNEIDSPIIKMWAVVDMKQQEGRDTIPAYTREILDRSYYGCFAQFFAVYGDKQIERVSSHVTREGYKYGTELSFTADFAHTYMLADDGELYYQLYPIRIPMRDIFQKCGMEAQYEFLRLQFVARLFDLVVPREISDRTPSLRNLAEIVKKAKNEDPKLTTSQIILNLIVPRTRILKDKEGIQRAFKRSEQDLGGDTEEEVRRRHQFFGRIGHPMRLRQGYKPHPQANQWAKDDGFWRDLGPDETWVRTIQSPVPVVHKQKGGKK